MIHHVVQFEWKPEATPAQIAAAAHALLGMRGQIAEIRDIRFGPNLAPPPQQYTHVLIVVCDDMAAVHRYAAHPVHRDVVANYTMPILATRLAVDLEVGLLPVPDGR